MRLVFVRCIGAVVALLMVSGVQGAVIVTAVEASGDVVFSMPAGGSIALTGLSLLTNGDNSSAVDPSTSFFAIGNPSGTLDDDIYEGITTIPGAFGGGGTSSASSAAGLTFWMGADLMGLPDGYISGALLGASTATFSGETFATLGITGGTYVWSWAADSVTLNVTAVPIPAAFWLFGSALGLLGWMRRKAA